MIKKEKINRRGQITTTDLLFSVIVFVVIVTTVIMFWNIYNERVISRFETELMLNKGIQLTDVFLKTPGQPSGWNRTNVTLVGLAYIPGAVSEYKAQEFCNISYTEARKILGLQYHFHFKVAEDGIIHAECGIEPTNDAKKVVAVSRPSIYGSTMSKVSIPTNMLTLTLWR